MDTAPEQEDETAVVQALARLARFRMGGGRINLRSETV